jgi:hypothetical protein
MRPLAGGALLSAFLLSGCAAGSPGGSSSPAPSSPSGTGTVVTFQVGEEQYRIEMTDPADIAIARQLLAGEEAPRIPNGRIVRGVDGGVNAGYSWYIDPASLEFADVTTEVCDGLPSYVEDGSLTGDYFCPWSAEVIAISE